MRVGALIVVALSISITAGCIESPTTSDLPSTTNASTQKNIARLPVVAVIDTGINPYHQDFRLSEPQVLPIDATTGVQAKPLSLSLGMPYDEARQADTAIWSSVQRNTLYAIPGTRIVGAISFGEYSAAGLSDEGAPVLDDVGHGTGVASVLANTTPNALIVIVETPLGKIAGDAVLWAANQPWIDVISISFGVTANIPTHQFDNTTYAQTRTAVEKGKIVVVAGGNEVIPAIVSSDAGPPWVISVGGAESSTHGQSVAAARLPDYVTNFTWWIADHQSATNHWIDKGTSLGTPAVAGTIAEILHRLREQVSDQGAGSRDGYLVESPSLRLRNLDVRAALNATALYWSTTEFNPTAFPYRPNDYALGATIPVLPSIDGTPVGPWMQMGWGFVDTSIVESTVGVLLGRTPPPDKADAESFIQPMFSLRESYWSGK